MSDSTTSTDRREVLEAVYRAIDAVNEQRTAAEQLPKVPSLPLIGKDSALDSLAFMTLVLGIERNVEEATGTPLDLLGSITVDSGTAQLKTVDSLVDLITRRLAE
jgi:acyl carrier protein